MHAPLLMLCLTALTSARNYLEPFVPKTYITVVNRNSVVPQFERANSGFRGQTPSCKKNYIPNTVGELETLQMTPGTILCTSKDAATTVQSLQSKTLITETKPATSDNSGTFTRRARLDGFLTYHTDYPGLDDFKPYEPVKESFITRTVTEIYYRFQEPAEKNNPQVGKYSAETDRGKKRHGKEQLAKDLKKYGLLAICKRTIIRKLRELLL